MGILFLQVGGTIDKDYPRGENNHGVGFEIGEPGFLAVLRRAKVAFPCTSETILRKDSLKMTNADRAAIRSFVKKSDYEQIILTHGTDTIRTTAESLSNISGKTVVLTGAMLPEKFRDSDADFNLGMAVAAVQCLSPGVYIALCGEVKEWKEFEYH